MKKFKSSMLAACCVVAVSSEANQAVVTFEGRMIPATCSVTVNGETNPTVEMPKISMANLGTAGVTSTMPISIVIDQCGLTQGSVTVRYSGLLADPADIYNTVFTQDGEEDGMARGVGVKISDANGSGHAGSQQFSYTGLTGSNIRVDHKAELVLLDSVPESERRPGSLNIPVTYEIRYR